MKPFQFNLLFNHANNANEFLNCKKKIFYGLMISCLIFFITCGGSVCNSDSSGKPTVKTGEEVLFNADDFPEFKTFINDPMYAKYVWSFGDGRGPVVESRSVTYTFTNPGEYTVTLEVVPATRLSDAGTPDDDDDDSWEFRDSDKITFKRVVTVTGKGPYLLPQVSVKPVLSLGFDGSIKDSSANPYTVTWRNGSAGSFVDGLSGKAIDLSGGKALVIDTDTLFGGRNKFTISFWARKKDLSQAVNCALWQGTENSIQPLVRFLIQEAAAGSRMLESDAVYTMTTAPVQTSAFNLSLDTSWHHYAFSYADGESHIYRDGIHVAQGKPAGALTTPATMLYIGYGESGADTYSFNGCIDDLRIYDTVLTERDLTRGFEVKHSDFHGHTAQYILVDIPEQVTSDTGSRLYAAVSGGGLSGERVLADIKGPAGEERFLLSNAELPGSDRNYVLKVQLQNASGIIVFENNESFIKTYDGNPDVGINENNAICLNGVPYFPVTPWGLGGAGKTDYTTVNEWVDAGYINALYGQGFWPPPWDVDGYRAYLDHASVKSMRVIGPATKWDGRGNLKNYGEGNYPFTRCSDLLKLNEYVEALRDHKANLMWQWMDEPELYGVGAHQERSWTYTSHKLDPQHLVATNFMGHPYSYVNDSKTYWYQERHAYTLGYNSSLFGTRKPIADVLGVDNYPLDGVSETTPDTMYRLGTLLDTIRKENLDLMPVISCVETADASNSEAGDPDHLTPWKPTVDQLKMITWFNVVHEVKGILWFHYFRGGGDTSTPAENLAFMKLFTGQIAELTPVVLGPGVSRSVSVTYGADPGRIDTMLRYNNGKWYLIAVRVSEFAIQPNTLRTPPPAAQDYSLTVSFNLGAGIDGTAADYEGIRPSIGVTNGQFSDTFEPFAVHIYEIE